MAIILKQDSNRKKDRERIKRKTDSEWGKNAQKVKERRNDVFVNAASFYFFVSPTS